jgi:hypothetical protein
MFELIKTLTDTTKAIYEASGTLNSTKKKENKEKTEAILKTHGLLDDTRRNSYINTIKEEISKKTTMGLTDEAFKKELSSYSSYWTSHETIYLIKSLPNEKDIQKRSALALDFINDKNNWEKGCCVFIWEKLLVNKKLFQKSGSSKIDFDTAPDTDVKLTNDNNATEEGIEEGLLPTKDNAEKSKTLQHSNANIMKNIGKFSHKESIAPETQKNIPTSPTFSPVNK